MYQGLKGRVRAFLAAGLYYLISAGSYAGEADYLLPWCEAAGGVAEYVLPDRPRVDCLTATRAVEFDFAPKWAEAIGQALYYASQSNRKAAVVLILRSPKDERYVRRLEAAIASAHLELDIWLMLEGDDLAVRK